MARPPGIWALAQLYSLQDQREMSNDFWFHLSAAPDLNAWDGRLAAINLHLALTNALVPVTAVSVKFLGVDLLVSDGTGTVGYAGYQTVVGGVSGSALPEDVSVIVQKDTASYLPGDRGRWYFSGVPEVFTTGSYLNNLVGEVAWSTAAPLLMQSITDQGIQYDPAHYSPSNNNLLNIKVCTAVALLGTRRRRRFRF